MAPDVSVIVVTWNAADHVDRCLSALLREGGLDGVDAEVLVVDNASADGTAEHVRAAWGGEVRVLETGRNGGMAAGNNAGMLAARGRAFLLCNSDAFLHPGAVRLLLDRLDTERGAGAPPAAVAPRLVNPDGSPQRSVRGFPTPWRYATEFLGLRHLARGSRLVDAFYGGGVALDRAGRVEWVTGACLLVPRAAVDAVGLMDEAYFMYGEEVDWLHRMRAAGMSVAYEPAAVATHVGGGSAGREWGRMYGVQLRNHVRYAARRTGPRAARSVRRIVLTGLGLRAAAFGLAATCSRGERRRSFAARAAAARTGAREVRAAGAGAGPEPVVPTWAAPRAASGVQQPRDPRR